jgi:hypothetical protein
MSSYSISSRERRPAGLHEIEIWVSFLRVLVQILHVGMRRCAVEIEVVLLDVLAVVALAVGETEEALLQNRIATVPQCDREAKPLVVIAEPRQAVLAPAIGA